jgi:hypothetical protein
LVWPNAGPPDREGEVTCDKENGWQVTQPAEFWFQSLAKLFHDLKQITSALMPHVSLVSFTKYM